MAKTKKANIPSPPLGAERGFLAAKAMGDFAAFDPPVCTDAEIAQYLFPAKTR
jgi:hypothetical protein